MLGFFKHSHYLLIAFAILPNLVRAQFSGLSTDSTGSVLYFATSHRQINTTQPFHGKIFRWDALNGISLVASLPEIVPATPPPPQRPYVLTNPFDLSSPQTSSDGSTLLIQGHSDSVSTGLPIGVPTATNDPEETSTTTLFRPGNPPKSFPGNLSISPNGRYALQVQASYRKDRLLIDLQTGASLSFPNSISPSLETRQPVSNRGTAIVADSFPSRLVVYSFFGPAHSVLNTNDPNGHSQVAIDADATTILYTSTPRKGPRSVRLFLSPGNRILSPPGLDCHSSSLSLDGTRTIFLCTSEGISQLYTATIPSGQPTPLPIHSAGLQSAILSGDGQVIFSLTNQGQILRTHLPTLRSSEITPPTPFLTLPRSRPSNGSILRIGIFTAAPSELPVPSFSVPGSLLRLSGAGLLSTTFTLDNAPLPILQSAANEAYIQIPWDTLPIEQSSRSAQVLVHATIPSPWLPPPYQLQIYDSAPTLLNSPKTGAPLAFHSNFSAPINASNPLRYNQIFHLYATGFGPTTPQPPTGQPSPLAPLKTPIQCTATTDDDFRNPIAPRPIKVLYAGLAPGLIGLYQLDLATPPDSDFFERNPYETLFFTCGSPENKDLLQFELPFSNAPPPNAAHTGKTDLPPTHPH